MVCFGWALAGGAADVATKHFQGDREQVRRQSVIFALQGVLERIGE
jgi:nicotinamide-nucleotide amidase